MSVNLCCESYLVLSVFHKHSTMAISAVILALGREQIALQAVCSLPANKFSLLGIHTVWVLSAWEQSKQSQDLPRTYEGRPRWGKAAYTAVYGAHLSSVPSGDRSANPATVGVPGRSDLQRAHISVSSARKRSGTEMLATPSGVSRAASSANPGGVPPAPPAVRLGGAVPVLVLARPGLRSAPVLG